MTDTIVVKIIHTLAFTLLLVAGREVLAGEPDHTAGWANGRVWKLLGGDTKFAYILGVDDSLIVMAPRYASSAMNCTCTFGEWVKGIDDLYDRDPAYINLPIFKMMELYVLRSRGSKVDDIDTIARRWLGILGNSDEPMIPFPLAEIPKRPKDPNKK